MERNERTDDKRFVIIDNIYAWVSVDPLTKSEGIIGWQRSGPVSTSLPLMGAGDWIQSDEVRNVVETVCRAAGMHARLVRFGRAEVVETVEPPAGYETF